MKQIYFERLYLAYNFIVGSIYLLWIYLMMYNKCECSKHYLETMIHIYWYLIFVLDILVFFNIASISNFYLILLGNLIGLGNIYMTYKYIKYLDESKCECSNMLLKNLVIIIYVITVIMIFIYFTQLFIKYILKNY